MVWRLIIGLVVFYFFLTIIMTKKFITSSILLSTLILSACNSTQKQNKIQQDTYTPTYKNNSTHSNISSYQIETPTQYPRIIVQTDTEPKNCNIKGNISYKN